MRDLGGKLRRRRAPSFATFALAALIVRPVAIGGRAASLSFVSLARSQIEPDRGSQERDSAAAGAAVGGA